MSRALALALLPLALLAASCGGSSSSASGTASAAEVTPADVVGFVSVDVDEGSDQWEQADELLSKFPIRERMLASIKESLADENIDYEQDVAPALGPTLDIAFFEGADGETEAVGLTQPDDEDKLAALLDKSDEPLVRTEIEGWTAFAEEQAVLDAFRAGGDKLSDHEAFADAMEELPEEANVKAYLSAGELTGALRRQVPQLGTVPASQFQWVSLALSSHDDGWKVDGAVKGGRTQEAFDRALLDRIPSGALVALAFDATNTSALDQLRDNPNLSQQSAQLEQLLGVRLEDVVELLRADTVLYVRQGAPLPEVTLVARPQDPDRALRTIDDAVERLAGFIGGTTPKRTQIGGVEVRQLELDRVAVSYGVREGSLIVSTSTTAFAPSGGPSLEDDPVFDEAAKAVDLPDDPIALAYVNLRDSIPVLEGFARAADESVPPELLTNLRPLDSFLAFSVAEGDVSHFSSLLKLS